MGSARPLLSRRQQAANADCLKQELPDICRRFVEPLWTQRGGVEQRWQITVHYCQCLCILPAWVLLALWSPAALKERGKVAEWRTDPNMICIYMFFKRNNPPYFGWSQKASAAASNVFSVIHPGSNLDWKLKLWNNISVFFPLFFFFFF